MVFYRVKSIDTDLFIVSTGFEKPGDRVKTQTPGPGIPVHRHLNFSVPISDYRVTTVTVRIYNGLYIGLDEYTRHLVWSVTPFEWQVAPSAPGAYQFYPMDGDDLYWYQNDDILPFVDTKPGPELVRPEPLFQVLAVED